MRTRPIFLTAALLVPALAARADTDYIRELARNKPRILITVSGPEAEGVGRGLQETIYRFIDWGKRRRDDVAVLSPEAAAERLRTWGPNTTVVFFLVGTEQTRPLPPPLASLLPLEPGVVGSRVSALRSVNDTQKPGDLRLRAGLYAPDRERLQRLYQEFTARTVSNFRDLPFATRHESNRLALFSEAALKPDLARWGRLGGSTWDDILWYDLAQPEAIQPDSLRERAHVFLTDRQTTPLSALPTEASAALGTTRIGPTTVAITSTGGADPTVVVSAPTTRLLKSTLAKNPSLAHLLKSAGLQDLPDLTQLGSTPLVIARATPRATPETIEAVHAHLAQALRAQGLAVEPRGSVLNQIEAELATQMVRGATETRGALLRKSTSRYMWVLTLTELTGRTTYRATERKLTREPEPFVVIEPERPRRRRDESERAYQDRYDDWLRRWDRWDAQRREWRIAFDATPCDWELSVSAESVARASGLLELVDTQAPESPRSLWSAECRAEVDDSRLHRQQRVTLRGHNNRPDSLTVPPAREEATPELILAAARRALGSGLSHLSEEAVLPEPGLALAPSTTMVPAEASSLVSGKVAEVMGQILTLNLGSRQGVKLGDRFELLLQFRETRDPDTGKVIRIRVQESVLVKVTEVDKDACDVVPVSPSEAAKLGKVVVGTPFRRVE